MKLLNNLKKLGPARAILNIASRIYRNLTGKTVKNFSAYSRYIYKKNGLEIGGPSNIFEARGEIPVYPIIKKLDNCNFSSSTIWEGQIQEGPLFQYDYRQKTGHQFISEASNLYKIPDCSYDFLLSSHCLEHSANPIKTVKEWLRVLKEDGILLLVLPHKEGTFDHRRPVTALDHLIDDYKNETTEEDLTHLPEILSLHDLSRDPMAGDINSFKARSLCNFENRCLHHHVFDTKLAIELLTYLNLQIIELDLIRPIHIAILCKKIKTVPDNNCFSKSYRSDKHFTNK